MGDNENPLTSRLDDTDRQALVSHDRIAVAGGMEEGVAGVSDSAGLNFVVGFYCDNNYRG